MTYVHDHTMMLHPGIKNLKGIVSIEGNIGAGKTTVMDILKTKYKELDGVKIVYVNEPVDRWTTEVLIPDEYRSIVPRDPGPIKYLDLFYGDQYRYSFPFQVLAYCTRTASVMEEVKRIVHGGNDEPFLIVMERSVVTDKVFARNLIKEGKFPPELIWIYDTFWNMMAGSLVPHMNAFIYLDASPERCIERMAKRNRSSESSVPVEYLRGLKDSHEEIFDSYKDRVKLVRVDWNADIAADHTIPDLENIFLELISDIINK